MKIKVSSKLKKYKNTKTLEKFLASKFQLLMNQNSIEKYKEEMKSAKDKKAELKAKAKMPPGTRLMAEDERV